MAKEPKSSGVTDYSSYVVRRNLEDYWRAEEKVELIVIGLTGKIPVTTLCKINDVTPSQYYEWREKFLNTGKQGVATLPREQESHDDSDTIQSDAPDDW